MNENKKEELVDEFRRYLDAHPQESQGNRRLDLFSFYSELTGLKNEVKIESRQVKKGLDEFRLAVSRIEESNHENLQTINDHFAKKDSNEAKVSAKVLLRPLFVSLLDIYDRIAAAGQTVQEGKQSFLSRFCNREREIIKATREGQEMTRHRLEELLADYNVVALQTVSKKFDPQIMRAVAADNDPQLSDGVVSEELRKGFLWDDEILRPAEVKVNRK